MDRPVGKWDQGEPAAPATFIDYWHQAGRRIDAGFSRQIPLFFDMLSPDQQSTVRRLLDGKRIRASLLCLVNETLGGDPERSLAPALAVEAVHSASLIHDDFIDRDAVRRQRPAEWAVMGARRAVLFADIIFATALRRMAEYNAEAGRILGGAIAATAAGAFEEYLEHPGRAAARFDPHAYYERVLRMKTAHMFGAATQLGAVSADAPPAIAQAAFSYGSALGEAYQIADDLCDIEAAQRGEHGRWEACLPALLRFADLSHSHAVPTEPSRRRLWCESVSPTVAARMRADMAQRAETALQHLAAFPEGRSKATLREAPSAVTALMCAEV